MNNQPTIVTVKELALELYIETKSLRKKIRDNGIPKPGNRWEWPEGHEDLTTIRSWKDQKATKKPKAKVEEPKGPKLGVIHESLEIGRGGWKIVREEEGIIAYYLNVKREVVDKTKPINSVSDIRPSLPKFIKAQIEKALQ